ncbi:MAG: thiamine phosphate synthase [Eubacterium sp.]|nr:thiamine phosphate synthase [Eubacterium sp.]
MKPEVDYTLYVCTDRDIMSTDRLEEAVELAIKGGASVIQLREKDATAREFYELAQSIKVITDAYEIPLIINDRMDIALAVHADGVHLGQKDVPVQAARDVLGPDRIVGATANTVEDAIEAWKSGADYLGVGDVFGSSTKNDTTGVTMETLDAICQAVEIPVVAIGGIDHENIRQLRDTKIAGVAVISAVLGQADITEAAESLIANFRG